MYRLFGDFRPAQTNPVRCLADLAAPFWNRAGPLRVIPAAGQAWWLPHVFLDVIE
jgi:hypothetical protein